MSESQKQTLESSEMENKEPVVEQDELEPSHTSEDSVIKSSKESIEEDIEKVEKIKELTDGIIRKIDKTEESENKTISKENGDKKPYIFKNGAQDKKLEEKEEEELKKDDEKEKSSGSGGWIGSLFKFIGKSIAITSGAVAKGFQLMDDPKGSKEKTKSS